MPILPPATPNIVSIGSFFTVGNCVANLPIKFGNRQNFGFPVQGTTGYSNQNFADGSIAVLAVVEAIKELTETYEFEELKYVTPLPPAATLTMSTGNPIISIGTLLGTIASNNNYAPQFQSQNFVDITDVYTFWMFFSGSVNQAGRSLKYRRVTTIDNYSFGVTSAAQGFTGTAPPVYYTRFGNVLQVGPSPDLNYAFYVRVKLRHPFPVGGTAIFTPATFSVAIIGGAVSFLSAVTGGGGYAPSTTIPLLFSSPPSGGVTATGTANTNSLGVVTGTTVTNAGSGYIVAPTVNTIAVSSQQVFMPDSWQEIVEVCAVQRLALWEGATEYVDKMEAILESKGIDIKGARARRAQMVRDELHNERAMSLRANAYTYSNG